MFRRLLRSSSANDVPKQANGLRRPFAFAKLTLAWSLVHKIPPVALAAMILNSYALLLGFVAVLRLGLGLLLFVLAGFSRAARQTATPEERTARENRGYLLFLLALLLVGLNVASWPLLYLLLESYVSEWPGVMCIYGVTQIGKGSLGPSHFLPGLLHFLQWAKPALVFLSGAWGILYLLNRSTATGPLYKRLFLLLVPLGAFAVADACAELAYLAIPKKEVFPSAGCCVGIALEDESSRFLPPILLTPSARGWLWLAYYGGSLGMMGLLSTHLRRSKQTPNALGMLLLLFADGAVLIVSVLFLIEVAAPMLLGLPDHHCAYDLIPRVPEAVVAAVLFLGGSFFVGWAGVARGLGRCRETDASRPRIERGCLRLALWGYALSLGMFTMELLLA